ncbi:MAG: alkaline phosphatase family protein, partial [Candidatus Nitrosopolaris sp.]
LSIQHCDPKLVMGYFDGNTVTALWNYAQHYAMSDNFHSSSIGPSLTLCVWSPNMPSMKKLW